LNRSVSVAPDEPRDATGNGTWFTRMDACLPQTAFAPSSRRHHWRVIEYATADRSGRLIFAPPDAQAPEVTLPLNLRGRYAVYAGLWGAGEREPFASRLKLTGDEAFLHLLKHSPGVEHLEEAFAFEADLTDRDLVIAPACWVPRPSAAIAYIRCAPVAVDSRKPAARTLISFNDGEGLFCRLPTTATDIAECIAPLADSDYGELCWGIVGERTGYPTEVGRSLGEDQEICFNRELTRQKRSLEILRENGIHPLRTAIDFAHRIGLRLHLCQRMGAFAAMPPYDEAFTARFYREHPEYRCVLADGRSIMRLSLAYPEVREYFISILCEGAKLGVDGIHLNYKRGAPFVMYEPPLVNGFREATGRDARELDEWDSAWLQWRAGAVTAFMRELRENLDAIGNEQGTRIELSATTHPTGAECRYFGLDLPLWIRDGLVDMLSPMGFSHGGKEVDLAWYRDLTLGTACRFCPHLPCGHDVWQAADDPVEALHGRARRYYAHGAEGLSIWDSFHYDTHATWRRLFGRLGHVGKPRHAPGDENAPGLPRLIPLASLGECDLGIRTIPLQSSDIYPDGTPHHAWLGL
jgi:hypothetical protein